VGVPTVGALLLFALVFVVFLMLACSGGGRPKPPVTPAMVDSNPAWLGYEKMQSRNTQLSASGVHQVPSAVAAWPSMWVGPAPVVVQATPAVVAPVLVQRRQPSASAMRAISHRIAS